MAFFKVSILTPLKVVAKDVPADSLLIPTTTGIIQVLPEHTHLVTQLTTGVLELTDGNLKKEFLITVGLCKILGHEIQILANVAEPAELINAERAKKAKEKAEEKLAAIQVGDDKIKEKYSRKLLRAEIRIKIAAKK